MALCDQHFGFESRIKTPEDFKVDQKKTNIDLYEKVNTNNVTMLRKQNAILGGIVIAVILLLLNIIFMADKVHAATQTINTVPTSDSNFMSDLQTFLKNEQAQRENLGVRGVQYGGIGATSADLTHTISTVVAFVEGYYVMDASVSHTYTASKRTFVYLSKDAGTSYTISAATMTFDGNFVFAEMASSTEQPATPSGLIPLFYADTNGTAITSITDLRTGRMNLAYYATLSAALTALGTTGHFTLVIPDRYVVTATTDASTYTNLLYDFQTCNGSFERSTGVTLTLSSPANIIARPNQQIFTGDGTTAFTNTGMSYAEWWGIDGTSDETEINKAIAASNTCQLLNKPYSIDGPILMTTSGQRLLGEGLGNATGLGGTVINLANGSDCNMITVSDGAIKGEIAHIFFNGNSANQSSGNGIELTANNYNWSIHHNDLYSIYGIGISLLGSVGNEVSNNNIYENKIHYGQNIAGIKITAGHNNKVYNNKITFGAGYGIWDVYGFDNRFYNNWIEDHDSGGFYADNAYGSFIENNHFRLGTGNDGIHIAAGSKGSIKDNMFTTENTAQRQSCIIADATPSFFDIGRNLVFDGTLGTTNEFSRGTDIDCTDLIISNIRFTGNHEIDREINQASESGTDLTTLRTATIPADSIGKYGHFRIKGYGTRSGTNGTYTFTLVVGTTSVVLCNASGNQGSYEWSAYIENRGATNVQRVIGTFNGESDGALTQNGNGTDDTTEDLTVTWKVQCSHADDTVLDYGWKVYWEDDI